MFYVNLVSILIANKLNVGLIEILSKWKAFKIDQSEIDSVTSIYKDKVTQIISIRENMRSPDKTDEEIKYKSLEKSNTFSQDQKEVNKVTSVHMIDNLEPDKIVENISMPHRIEFYRNKLTEFTKLITDK